MRDLLFVAITVGFFAISWLYVKAAGAFDRLARDIVERAEIVEGEK